MPSQTKATQTNPSFVLNIHNNSGELVSSYQEMLHKITFSIFNHLHLTQQEYEIALVFTDLAKQKAISKEFAQKETACDVLSFSTTKHQADILGEQAIDLGDIMLCLPKAVVQATKYGHSLLREVGFLYSHGLLHLLGYDHKSAHTLKEMLDIQEVGLKSVNLSPRESTMQPEQQKVQVASEDATQYKKYFLTLQRLSKLAYCPYSNFRVSALIIGVRNQITFTIKGVNVENVSSGATICAERTALSQMPPKKIKKQFVTAILIYADTEAYIRPCGICRQTMSEMLAPNCQVVMFNKQGQFNTQTVAALLPFSFTKLS